MCGKKYWPFGRLAGVLFLFVALACFSGQPLYSQNSTPQNESLNTSEKSSTDIVTQLLGNSEALALLIQNLSELHKSREEIGNWLLTLSAEQLAQLKIALPLLVNLGPYLEKNEQYYLKLDELIPRISALLNSSWKEVDQYKKVQNNNGTLKVISSVSLIIAGGSVGYIIGSWKGSIIGIGIAGIFTAGVTIVL